MLDLYITTFATLFVIIDPIGVLPLFVALTQGMTGKERLGVSIRALLIAVILLAMFALAGEALLTFVGISFPAFRIAGGLLLFLIAVDMLFEKRTERREKQADTDIRPDPSVFPLATPLIAGPGALATMVLVAGEHGSTPEAYAVIIGAMLTVLAVMFTLFLFGGTLERILGQTGISVITRLLGTILAALAVQFVLDGFRGLGLLP